MTGFWDIIKKFWRLAVLVLALAIFMAAGLSVGIGMDFRFWFGVFIVVGSIAVPFVLNFPKVVSWPIAILLGAIAIFTIWPGMDYLLAKWIGPYTAASYVEWKTARDIQVAESTKQKDLEGRDARYKFKKKRAAQLSREYKEQLSAIYQMRSQGLLKEGDAINTEKELTLKHNKEIEQVWANPQGESANAGGGIAESNFSLSSAGFPNLSLGNIPPFWKMVGIIFAGLVFLAFVNWLFSRGGGAAPSGVGGGSTYLKAAAVFLVLAAVGYLLWPSVKSAGGSMDLPLWKETGVRSFQGSLPSGIVPEPHTIDLNVHQFFDDGRKGWNPLLVKVYKGDIIHFTCKGTYQWDPAVASPNNEVNCGGATWLASRVPAQKDFPLPDAAIASIVGRTGEGSKPFYIGTENTYEVLADCGVLDAAINDRQYEPAYRDNNGTVEISIDVYRAQGPQGMVQPNCPS